MADEVVSTSDFRHIGLSWMVCFFCIITMSSDLCSRAPRNYNGIWFWCNCYCFKKAACNSMLPMLFLIAENSAGRQKRVKPRCISAPKRTSLNVWSCYFVRCQNLSTARPSTARQRLRLRRASTMICVSTWLATFQ